MTPTPPVPSKKVDEDLAHQAHLGHGVPSQDPAAAAQFPLEPEEVEREANSVLMGGGMMAGAASGAALGVVVAGPVGVVVGGTMGAVVGALGAAAAGSMAKPEVSNRTDTTSADTVRVRNADNAAAGRPTAQVDKVIAASAPDVWTALTTPAALKQFFLGADVVTDWKVGSPIRMTVESEGKTYEDKGEIVTFEAPRQLSFSRWSAISGLPDTPANYHLLTFDLVPAGEATKVTLTQANLTGGVTSSDIEHRVDCEKTWASVLDRMAKLLTM